MDQSRQESRLVSIQRDLKAWYTMIPQCLTMVYKAKDHRVGNNGKLRRYSPNENINSHSNWVTLGRLHLAYYATTILLFRALMAPASEEAKHNPASSLRCYFGEALGEATLFSKFVDSITQDDVEAFWGRREW